jgi:hypothetical protein
MASPSHRTAHPQILSEAHGIEDHAKNEATQNGRRTHSYPLHIKEYLYLFFAGYIPESRNSSCAARLRIMCDMQMHQSDFFF